MYIHSIYCFFLFVNGFYFFEFPYLFQHHQKNGAVLSEAEYEKGRFTGMKSYNVTDDTDEIEVSGKTGNRYMLWDSKGGMYQLADSVTVD